MAELVEPYDGFPEYNPAKDDFSDYLDKEEEILSKLKREAPDSPEEGLENALIRFHVADGYAMYRVVSEEPLQIQHIPFGDRYKIPAAHVRGLRKEDVVRHMF